MQIPENSSQNDDIREILAQLGEKLNLLSKEVEELRTGQQELSQKVDRIDYKFDVYQKGTDGMVKMATTIIIAAASVVVLFSLSPAIAAVVTALSSANLNLK